MQWSLEKIYREQVKGNIPQRKHLNVIGENNTPQQKEEAAITLDKIKNLIDDINVDETDPKQMQKLFNIISNFEGYRPIKGTLESKGFNPLVLKKFSNEIQSLIVDLPREERQQFFNFLEKGSDVMFPENETGNLYDLLTNAAGVSRGVAEEIMKHTGQDAAKRGVGMGELALALLFKNIDAAGGKKSAEIAAAEKQLDKSGFKKGMKRSSYTPEIQAAKNRLEAAKKLGIKGDLELNGNEFEIKGENASLGPTSDAVQPSRTKPAALKFLNEKLGITVDGTNYIVNGEVVGDKLGLFPVAVTAAFNAAEDKEDFKQSFKDYLKMFGKFEDEILNSVIYQTIDLSNPKTIQRGIPVLNLYRYTKEEGFPYFMAHDVGQGEKGVGNYVFASGSPEEIARKIYNNRNVKFEKVSYNGLRPRIGFKSSMVEDNEMFIKE